MQKDSRLNSVKEKLSKDLILFGKICLPSMFSSTSPRFHYEIAEKLEDKKINKLNIIAPRGHAKSSLVACVFPLWHILTEAGSKFVVLSSKTEGHAVRLLQTIKNALEYSMELRGIYGYWGQHSARNWSRTEIVLKDDTMIMCRGTGQQVVGLKHGNQRPTVVVLDDPEDMNNTKTSEAMEFNLRWLLQSLVPALDAQKGRLAVIGTPQHQRCMVETLMATDGWDASRYKALQDDGTALWPEMWSEEKLLAEKKSLDSIGRVSSFYREYQCEIIGDEDQMFKEAYIQHYKGELKWVDDEPHMEFESGRYEPVNIFMGVDPASSVKKYADYSTIVSVAVDSKNNKYVLPYFRKRSTPMALADSIIEYFKKYKPAKTRIESVGYQEMLREYLRAKAEEEGLFIPGLEIKESPRTSKSLRLETMQPWFAQKKIYLLDNMSELEDELLMFPRGKHDDLLDGLYYATKNNYIPHHGKIAQKEHHSPTSYRKKSADWMIS